MEGVVVLSSQVPVADRATKVEDAIKKLITLSASEPTLVSTLTNKCTDMFSAKIPTIEGKNQ